MEKEKFDLQKRHTENIQELLEDTNVRLNKMENEYMAQTQSTVSLFFLFLPFLETIPLISMTPCFSDVQCVINML